MYFLINTIHLRVKHKINYFPHTMHAPFEAYEGAMREAIERQFDENRQRQLEEDRQAEQQRLVDAQRAAEEQRIRAELENQRIYAENVARRRTQQQLVTRRQPIVYDLDTTDTQVESQISLTQIRKEIQLGKNISFEL